MIALGYVFSILYGVICLAIGLLAYKLGAPKKITRKIVHILVGFEWIVLNHFFGGGIHLLIVCLLFLALLVLSHWKKLLPMIESDADNSLGTIYYAVAMSIMALITMFLPDMMIPFGIGVFCTSLGDGFAGLLGQMINTPSNPKIYGNKTLYGTLYNFIICFIVVGVIQKEFSLNFHLWQIVSIAIFATLFELLTGKGLDNITVTLGAAFLSYFLSHFQWAENYIIPILITPVMIAFAYKKKALTLSGIIAAIVVDLLISVSLGNFGFTILLAFFVGGIITDKIKNKYKKRGRNKKTDKKSNLESRDHIQVLANSGVAAICSALYIVTGEKVLVVAFVASLAEAFADTAASGVGVLCGKAYDPFRRRPCTPGISGGMSLLGTSASAVAAMLISAIAFCFKTVNLTSALIVVISAILGGIFDSFLGSLLQVKYRCPVCESITEREEHCSNPTVKHCGIRFINNNTVNLLGTLFSAVLAGILYIILM